MRKCNCFCHTDKNKGLLPNPCWDCNPGCERYNQWKKLDRELLIKALSRAYALWLDRQTEETINLEAEQSIWVQDYIKNLSTPLDEDSADKKDTKLPKTSKKAKESQEKPKINSSKEFKKSGFKTTSNKRARQSVLKVHSKTRQKSVHTVRPNKKENGGKPLLSKRSSRNKVGRGKRRLGLLVLPHNETGLSRTHKNRRRLVSSVHIKKVRTGWIRKVTNKSIKHS